MVFVSGILSLAGQAPHTDMRGHWEIQEEAVSAYTFCFSRTRSPPLATKVPPERQKIFRYVNRFSV